MTKQIVAGTLIYIDKWNVDFTVADRRMPLAFVNRKCLTIHTFRTGLLTVAATKRPADSAPLMFS